MQLKHNKQESIQIESFNLGKQRESIQEALSMIRLTASKTQQKLKRRTDSPIKKIELKAEHRGMN